MKSLPGLRLWRLAAAVCLLAGLPACSLFHHPKKDAQANGTATTTTEIQSGQVATRSNSRGLTVELKTSPDPVKLGEVRQIDVTFTLRNTTKEPINLKFASSQTIEILLREQSSGKVVSQWSTDQTFQQSTRYMAINPKERIEYNQPITTRDLHAGVTYALEAYFVGYEQDLRASRPIIPQP
jgi:hypothetical protein